MTRDHWAPEVEDFVAGPLPSRVINPWWKSRILVRYRFGGDELLRMKFAGVASRAAGIEASIGSNDGQI